MHLCKLTKYSDTYSKISGSYWYYYKDEPALNDNENVIYFPNDNNNNISFKFKQQITGKTGKDGSESVEILVSLKYLSNSRRTLEMPLIHSEISLMFTYIFLL